MADFNRGMVLISDVTENGFDASQDWQLSASLESFAYDYAMPLNEAEQAFGATEPATLDFSIRLHKSSHAKIIINNSLHTYDNIRLSFLFDPTFNKRKRVTNYKDGIVVDGYVVQTEVEFRSGKNSQGRERQTILHVRLLLRSVTHITGMNAKKVLTTTFVIDKEEGNQQKLATGDSRLRLAVYVDNDHTLDFVSVAGSKTQRISFDDRTYMASLQSLSLTKAIYRPNEIKARLFIFPLEGVMGFISREKLETVLCHKKAILTVNDNYPVCEDYFVQDVIPSYCDDGKIYVDLIIYSPDYILTTENGCRSFVGRKLSEVAKELVGSLPLPYDQGKTLEVGDMAANMKHLVYNHQEHTLPYLVQYNESIYDFLRRTTNRWGEFMYYDNGRLNFGYGGNAYHAHTLELSTPETEKKDYVKVCHAISYTDPTADKSAVDSVSSISLEAAQEFLDNMLVKDEYEEPLYRNMDNVVGDLVSYGLARRYTDEQRNLFNHRYFEDPNIGTSFNEFTEKDPMAFKTFDTETYKKVLAQELSRGRSTIQISFDTRYPAMSLGDMFKFGEKSDEYYLITEISMHLQDSRPVWKARAIRASGLRQINVDGQNRWHIDFYPPYLPSGHTRKSGLLQGTVVDADDPLRQNRVRIRFDWQDNQSTPTPWLLVAQDGTTPGAGSHMRHYKGEQVLVGFIGGNVERPYVIGAIQQELPVKENWDSPIDAILRTPHGQRIQMSDGTGAGLTAFRTAMDPAVRAMQNLVPGRNLLGTSHIWKDKDNPENKRFEGNVEISDHYHIYQIKCSTSDRQVSINSPWGHTDFKAFTGINITAPNGDIRISGKNVTIEASNNLRLISGTNIKKKQCVPEDWSKSFSGSIAAQAAAKVLLSFDEKGAIDFAMLRHICDRFIKPVEGVLEIQSNQFLKLEADGASTGYPMAEYKMNKVDAMADLKEEQWYQMGPAIAELISQSWIFMMNWFRHYKIKFDTAIYAKEEFDKYVRELKHWSEIGNNEDLMNLDGTRICNLYGDLKDRLFSSEKLTEADMGFMDDLVGVDKDAKTTNSRARKLKEHDYILKHRNWLRDHILMCAHDMQTRIQGLRKWQFSTEKINKDDIYWMGLHPNLPENYLDVVKQAFSEEKCASKSELYQIMTHLDGLDLTDDKYKKPAKFHEPETAVRLTALKHLVALNLLEELGFKARKNNEVVTISSLVESEDDLVKNWNKTASYIVYEYPANEKKENSVRKRKVCEQDVWGNAKSGQILISSGKTYAIGKEIKAVSNTTQDLLKTEHLVEKLSSPIEKAMEVGAISNL